MCQPLHSITVFMAQFLKSAVYLYISMKKYSKLYPETNPVLHSCETTILTPGKQLMNENKSRIWPWKKKKSVAETLPHGS